MASSCQKGLRLRCTPQEDHGAAGTNITRECICHLEDLPTQSQYVTGELSKRNASASDLMRKSVLIELLNKLI
jgi:hypothetical protein